MKNILILSFMYENENYIKYFNALKDHYNKIINYFCFPMKYYGVRATEEGETRIDEKNQIIWLHTDNIKEYDKNLSLKVIDTFSFIEQSNIEYDVIIKTNCSTILNLVLLNKYIQNNLDKNCIFCSMWLIVKHKNFNINVFGGGNCLTLNKNQIQLLVKEKDNNSSIQLRQMYKIEDDVYIARILINNNTYYLKNLGQYEFYENNMPWCAIKDVDDIFNVAGIRVKHIVTDKYTTDYLHFMMFVINYIEKKLILSKCGRISEYIV